MAAALSLIADRALNNPRALLEVAATVGLGAINFLRLGSAAYVARATARAAVRASAALARDLFSKLVEGRSDYL